jgi:GNAT superfamily N-acetyltransferase
MGLVVAAISEIECELSKEIRSVGSGNLFTERGAAAEIGPKLREQKLITVRDFKDKFILQMLQKEAMLENPGFKWFDEHLHKARILWALENGSRQPVGYYFYRVESWEDFKHVGKIVDYPDTLIQLFVTKANRRKGYATLMVQDFIGNHPGPMVWVESPKRETVKLLKKLGYREGAPPYELWQMWEGLTKWVNQKVTPHAADWQGTTSYTKDLL